MGKVATVTIKYTEAEVELLINSLEMTISTRVPCVDSGQWKTPYESLQKDLRDVKEKLIRYKHSKTIDQKHPSGTNNPEECYDCED